MAQVPELQSIQGTAAYNLLWHTTTVQDAGLNPGGTRFSGRVAARAGRGVYIGVSIGSWHFEQTLQFGGETQDGQLTSLGTAVVGALYVQAYPARSLPLFARAGLGTGRTRTYSPDNTEGIPTLRAALATRFAPTIGVGADIPLVSHLALTVATDATFLIGVQGGRELKSALAASVGLTVR